MFKYTCAAAAILLLAGCQSMHKKKWRRSSLVINAAPHR